MDYEDLERVPTGIEELDELLNGGLIKNRTYLLAGETGSGKTILSLQYLLHGLMNGESCLYVTNDEPDSDIIYRGARGLGFELEKFREQQKFEIISGTKYFGLREVEAWKAGADGISRPTTKLKKYGIADLVKSIKERIKVLKVTRLVIDPIAPFISPYFLKKKTEGVKDVSFYDYFKDYDTTDPYWVRVFLQDFVAAVTASDPYTGVGAPTTIITSEIPTGEEGKMSRYGVEEYIADGVFILGLERTENGYERTLFIRKMRWTPVHPTIYKFKIEPNKGIVFGQ